MHTIVRYYLKTSLVFLVLGVMAGLHLLTYRYMLLRSYSPAIVAAHVHVLLVGFLLMMVMGMGLWMFPRPAKSDTHYTPTLAHVTYWLVTGGTVVRFFCEWFAPLGSINVLSVGVLLGGTSQAVAVFLFVWNIWTRIRPLGSQIREAKGERF